MADLFLLKKVIGVLIMPFSIIIILLLLSLLSFNRSPKFSFRCFAGSFILLLVLSFGPVADRLISPIEQQYPAFTKSKTPVDYIIILGCGHSSNDKLPALSQLKHCSLERLVEAVRIYQLYPNAQIIASGYSGADQRSNAEVVKEAAISLGVPRERILTEPYPLDTEEEAILIAPRIKGSNAILVTSASHMPRAMKFFNQQGSVPIAAPAGFNVKNIASEKGWGYWIPSVTNLQKSTTAWYESVGQLWQWLKFWLP